MSRILIDARMIDYSGIGRYTDNLLAQLAKGKHAETIELLADVDTPSAKLRGIKTHRTNIKPYGLAEQTRLAQIINELNPDLVHFTHINQPVFNLLKMPCVTTVHDLTMLDFPTKDNPGPASKLKQKILQQTFPKILKNNQLILTPTQYVADQLVARFGLSADKVHVSLLGGEKISTTGKKPNGVGFNEFFLYVGNDLPHKNLDLIKRFARLKPDLNFVVAGAEGESTDNLINTGHLSDAELSWLYRNAEALIMPSFSEGFGLPGIEAMSANCPVLSSSYSCLPEVYGKAAIYFDPKSTTSLGSAIERLTNPANRKQLIAAGGKQAKKFSWSETAGATYQAYQQALSQLAPR